MCCTICTSGLTQWLNKKRTSMPFGVPMVWREPKNHVNDCYFCMTKVAGFTKKSKHKITYPECESAIKPVRHNQDLLVPVPPSDIDIESANSCQDTNIILMNGGCSSIRARVFLKQCFSTMVMKNHLCLLHTLSACRRHMKPWKFY